MKTRIFVLLISLSGCLLMMGQGQDSKKINQIKRNSSYLYAEATMETESESFQVAQELLANYINEYIDSKKKLSEANNVIVKDIVTKCEKIQMQRGEMTRVFVYVKKSDIIPSDNAISFVKTDSPPLVDDMPLATVEDIMPGESNNKCILVYNEQWHHNMIQELIALTSLTDAKSLLNRLKAEYKIKRYGSYNEYKDQKECSWVISDKEGILTTILVPGVNGLVNYKTMTDDSLQNYSGQNAIWFTISK